MNSFLSFVAHISTKHPKKVLVAALIITFLSIICILNLKILTSRRALIPEHVEASKRLKEFIRDFGTPNNLIVVLKGEPCTLAPFAEDLATQLHIEKDVIQDVFYKIDIKFFLDRAFLFLPFPLLEKIKNYLQDNHEYIVKHINNLNGLISILENIGEAEPHEQENKKNIDIRTARVILSLLTGFFSELERWLTEPDMKKNTSLVENIVLSSFPEQKSIPIGDGYLRSHDKSMLFMFIQPANNSDEFDVVHILVEKTRHAAYGISKNWEAAGKKPPQIGLTGIPAIVNDEVLAIRHDIKLTTLVASVSILLIVVLGFKSLRRAILVFTPLALAGIWNLGLTFIIFGHLNILTSFFTAILFGLGIDYGIFVLTRVEQEISSGLSLHDALNVGLKCSGRTLITAGGTSAIAFFVIGTVEFTGFAELGIVAGAGVVLVMLAFLTVLPSLITLVKLPVSVVSIPEPQIVYTKSRLIGAGLVSCLVFGVASLSVYMAFKIPIDFNLMNVLPTGLESAHYQKEMAEKSDYQPEFVAALVDNLKEVRRLTKELESQPLVSRVESITSLIPEDQERKIKLIVSLDSVFQDISLQPKLAQFTAKELVSKINNCISVVEEAQDQAFSAGHVEIVKDIDKLISRMKAVEYNLNKDPEVMLERVCLFEQGFFSIFTNLVNHIKQWPKADTLSIDNLPSGIVQRFRGKNGRYVIYFFPRGSIYNVEFLDKFLSTVYKLVPNATGFPCTHQVFSRMVVRDFRKATLLATLVVLIIFLFDFRHIGYTLLAVLPLALGSSWMFGCMYIFNISFNYANMIALPLIIGLAVDYGVFMTHRLRENKLRDAEASIKKTIKPVVLAALTTVAGVGAICVGEHRGISSLGQTLILGVCACLIAAIVALPALVNFIAGLKKE